MKKELTLVGIGSSAGGLEALQTLFSKIEEMDDVAYIVAQHLSPTHKSMMVELLARVSNISVQEAKNGLVIREKTIYITPENTDVYVKDKKIYLKSINHIFGPKPSVNYLFSSIAEEYQHRAIGVILSGTGSDGAYGIRAIKAEGGITIAQSPTTAKYDGMPFSAINTGKVDLVVPVSELANELKNIVGSLGKDLKDGINQNYMQEIFKMLFDETGVDFSMYKKNTITRRLVRRLQALKVESIPQYVDFMKKNPGEVSNLYQDILIGVTQFFRDEEVFKDLENYISAICEKKEQGEEIRFWSVGCSTGEEAYSLAILVSEILGDKVERYKIKIFATDIDDESLKIARAGVYSETSLLSMKKDYIHKYFNVLKNQYEIKKSIREMVVFSKHNIVSDSPFLRIDLISCRNMLIYFNNGLQQRVFPIFHYALKDNGLLLLGKSETVAEFSDLFYLLNKNNKIFKSQYTGIKEAPKLYNYSGFKTMHNQYDRIESKKDDEQILEESIVRALHESILEQCIIINTSNEIVYNKGKVPYLQLPQGKMTHNLFKLVDENLVLDLRTAINEVNKTNTYQKIKFREVTLLDNVTKLVRALIVPIISPKDGEEFKVIFFESEDQVTLGASIDVDNYDDKVVLKLKEELETNKVHLQNVIEELETSYEEMQSLNEELQSSNEELQSSNEELETTNEELQSTNEELQTAYSELKILYDDKDNRTKLLEDLTNKLKIKTDDYRKQKEISEAIINSVPVSIIFVDKNCIMTYINANAKKLLNLSSKNVTNKAFDNRTWKFYDLGDNPIENEDLPFAIIKKTFEKIENFSLIINLQDKNLYLNVSGAPLFDSEGKFKGAVFSLDDITQNIQNSKIMDDYKLKLSSKNDDNILNAVQSFHTYSMLQKEDNNSDIMRYMFNEFNIDYRNRLNEVNLILSQMKNKTNEKNSDKIESILANMTARLDDFESYFEVNSFEKSDLSKSLINSLKLFETVFTQKDIVIKNSIETLPLFIEDRSSKQFLMILFEMFIYIKDNISDKLEVELSSIESNIIVDMDVNVNKLDDCKKYFHSENSIYKALSSSLNLLGMDVDINVDKNIKIKILYGTK